MKTNTSEQKKLFDIFRQSFQLFRHGVMWLDNKGKVLGCNPKFAEDHDLQESGVKGKTIFEINPHLSLLEWKKRWKALEKKRTFIMETEHMNAAGMLFPVKVQAVLIDTANAGWCLAFVENLMETRRYKHLLQLASKINRVGAFELDLVHQRLLLTEQIYELLGIPSTDRQRIHDDPGSFLQEHLNEKDFERLKQDIRRAVKDAKPFENEILYQTGQGAYLRLRLHAIPVESELQTIKVCGTVQDTANFTARQEDLHLTQYTIDHAQEMIFWIARNGSLRYVNHAVCHKLGYSRDELLQLTSSDIIRSLHEERRDQIWQDLERNKEIEFEADFITRDGRSFPTYSTVNYIEYKDEKIACVFSRDWTQKKERDQRLSLTQITMDTAVEMIFWLSPENQQVVYANETARNKLGLSARQLSKISWNDLDLHFPEAKQDQKAYWASAFDRHLETVLQTKNGQKIPVELTFNQVELEDAFLCLLARDISGRKEKEKQLESALAKVEELSQKLTQENMLLKEEINLEHNFNNIISTSPRYKQVLKKVEQVAATDATVLIAGETGTGKELLARAIHVLSNRDQKALVKVNCAALPPSLIENELFGHEKGAFTGAYEQKQGRFELADGGTIFLDEIGELPLDMQVKILRVLQEGEFERVGGAQTIRVNVRVIAATNRNLEEMVYNDAFREDLYYRLNVFPIHNIPLRERREDIPLLVRHFTQKYSDKTGKQIDHIPEKALRELIQYDFPGNVRELENIVERAVILSNNPTLNLSASFSNRSFRPQSNHKKSFPSFEEAQRRHIIAALERTAWRVTGPNGAARLLQLNDRTLASKMRRLGIRRENFVKN